MKSKLNTWLPVISMKKLMTYQILNLITARHYVTIKKENNNMYKLFIIENNDEYVKYAYTGDCNDSGTIFIHKKSGLITIKEDQTDDPFSCHLQKKAESYFNSNVYPEEDTISIY